MRSFLPALLRNQRGGPATEFVLVLPITLLLVLGFGDLAYQAYLESVLTGAVQKAGRDSTIQGAATQSSQIDQKVINAVKVAAPRATFVSSRANYDNYSEVGPEPFTDTNHNGARDRGECYSDVNANSQWDSDPGQQGQGGASDVTVYKMQATFPRLFPFAWLVGWSQSVTITASTVLKNQPYATQTVNTVSTICTP
jgi:Flp pilus assembly protein TadG